MPMKKEAFIEALKKAGIKADSVINELVAKNYAAPKGVAMIPVGTKRYSIFAFEEEKREKGWFTVDVALVKPSSDVKELIRKEPNIQKLLADRRKVLEEEEKEKEKEEAEEEEK